MKKIFIVLLVLCGMSCSSNQSKKDILNNEKTEIAYNADKSIVLSKKKLSEWLAQTPSVKMLTRKQQINSYFLQQALLQQNESLDNIALEKVNFELQLVAYNKASKVINEKNKEQVKVQKQMVDNLYKSYQLGAELSKHKVRLYQIFKRYPVNATTEQKSLLMQSMQIIRNKIVDLETFKQLASLESNAQSRLRGGLIGNVKSGLFSGELNKIVMAMHKDELSEIIKGKTGLLLFYCADVIKHLPKTNEQLKKQAYNRIKQHQTEKDWQQFQKDRIEALNIIYNWDVLQSKDEQVVIASTLSSKITKRQLEWVANTSKRKKELSNMNKNLLQNFIDDFFLKQQMFQQLSIKQQQYIEESLQQQKIEAITTAVLINIINKRFEKPTPIEVELYYKKHQDTFNNPRKYQLSALGMMLDKDDKLPTYQKAESIYNDINSGRIKFSQALKKYSQTNNRFTNGQTKPLSMRQISYVFGINIRKQLELMQTGEISDLVETDSGYLWIIRLDNIFQPNLATLIEVYARIEKILGTEKLNKIEKQVNKEILLKQQVTIL